MLSTSELLAPIPGEQRAGVHLRYEPLYDQIKEARREDDDLPQGDWQTSRKLADWPLVIKLSSEALSKRSKDLQLAAWLTEALLRRDGMAGLRQGISVVHELLDKFWDDVYPEIDDGDVEMRAAPLEWIGTKLDIAVRHVPLTADRYSLIDYGEARRVPTKDEAEADNDRRNERDRAVAEGRLTPEDFEASFVATPKEWYRTLVEDIDGVLEAIGTLDEFCQERFGADAPSFMVLRDTVREVRQTAGQLFRRKLELEPDVGGNDMADISLSAAVAATDASGPALAAAGRSGGGMPASGPNSSEEAALWIAAAAARVRQDNPADPSAYLLLRGFRWGELRAHGVVDPRLLAAPSTEVRTRLRGLLLDGRWTELLEAAETVMATASGRGWLDLQRYVLTACDGLGGDYEIVGNAIRGALRGVLTDVPDLPALTLMDDSPTANAETLAWLRGEGLIDTDVDSEPVEAARGRRRPAAQRDAYDVARERVRAGDTRGAMELLMREAMQEKSARARFLRRTQAAEIMVGAGLEPVALPILRELLDHVDSHRLEEWEAGETIALPLSLLYRCVQRLDSNEVDRNDLYVRICRLDPLQAMQLGDSGPDNEGT